MMKTNTHTSLIKMRELERERVSLIIENIKKIKRAMSLVIGDKRYDQEAINILHKNLLHNRNILEIHIENIKDINKLIKLFQREQARIINCEVGLNGEEVVPVLDELIMRTK